MREDIVIALDVGTTRSRVVVGQVAEGMTQIIGLASAPNNGMRKGSVIDVEETVSSISAALDEAEKACGFTIEDCIASIGGSHITAVESRGVVAVSRADGEILEEDIEKAVEAAKSVALPPNFEIIHIIPNYYTVDGQPQVKDPVGMSGIRLEVSTHVIGVAVPSIRNLTKAITQAGLQIEGLVFTPIAAAKACLNKKQKEIGVMAVDFGASCTSIAVFIEGALVHSRVIPIGANHITNDIAIGLKIGLDAADKIKLEVVEAVPTEVKESEKVDLHDYEPGEKERPSRRYVCEIAEARLNEIFGMIRDELKSIELDGLLPAGAVIVGGGAKMKNLQQFAKRALSLPVQIGKPIYEVSGLVEKLDDPEYATAIGLMLWGIDEMHSIVSNKNSSKTKVNFGKVGGILDKVKGIFKNLLP